MKFCCDLLSRISNCRSICSTTRFLAFKKAEKNLPKDLAMQHFDEFYGPLFQNRWPSIRLGLLCPHKYCAVINPFVDVDEIYEKLGDLNPNNLQTFYNKRLSKALNKSNVDDGSSTSAEETDEFEDSDLSDGETIKDTRSTIDSFVPISQMLYQEEVITDADYHRRYKSETAPVNFEKELVPFPKNWNIVFLQRGNLSRFPIPPKDNSGLYGYYLLDGASLLPVWALNISLGNDVADYCAAPGGKSLSALYTFCPKSILCNDMSASRMTRLEQVFRSYLPDLGNKIKVKYSKRDARLMEVPDGFDRILLDVPCTNDRMSCVKDENSLFKPVRMKERVTLPQLQSELLFTALKSLRVEGSLVYSTCTLSPMQNDGVVHVTLKKLWEETTMNFVVKDLKDTFKPLDGIFRFDYSCKYGLLVLPFLPSNFGPMYFSKITRKM